MSCVSSDWRNTVRRTTENTRMESTACRRHFIIAAVLAAVTMTKSGPADAADHGARWGLDDVTATVGFLFRYHVTSKLSYVINESCVARLKINEMGKETVPSWLTVDLDSCSTGEPSECDVYIEGVPGLEYSRQRVFMSVSYVRLCKDVDNPYVDDVTEEIENADVFIIDVQNADETGIASADATVDARHLEPVHCRQGKTITTAVVVVEGNTSQMSASDRVAIVRRFAAHLRLPVSVIRLLPSSSVYNIDSTVLVAGPGDSERLKPMWAHLESSDANQWNDASLLQWTVGCGNVHAVHMPVLERLELTALDGSLSAALRRPITGWHVANQQVLGQQRFKRRLSRLFVQATATPQQPSAVRPTSNAGLATVALNAAMTSSQITPTRWNGRSTESTAVLSPPSHTTKEHWQAIGSTQLPAETEIQTSDDVTADVTESRTNLEPSVSDFRLSSNSGLMVTSPLPHSNHKPGVMTANQKRKTIELQARSTVVKKPTKRTTTNTRNVGFSTTNFNTVDDVIYKTTAAPSTVDSITSHSNELTHQTVTKKTIKRTTTNDPSVGISRNGVSNNDVINTSTGAPRNFGFSEEFDNSIFSESTIPTGMEKPFKRTNPVTPSVDYTTKDYAIDDVMHKTTPATLANGLGEDFNKSVNLSMTKKLIKLTTASASNFSSSVDHTENDDVIYASTEVPPTDGLPQNYVTSFIRQPARPTVVKKPIKRTTPSVSLSSYHATTYDVTHAPTEAPQTGSFSEIFVVPYHSELPKTIGMKKPTKQTTPNAPSVGYSTDDYAIDDVMHRSSEMRSTGGLSEKFVTSYSSESRSDVIDLNITEKLDVDETNSNIEPSTAIRSTNTKYETVTQTDENKPIKKNTKKLPMTSTVITSALPTTFAKQQPIMTDTNKMAKSSDAVQEVTSLRSILSTEAPSYSAGYDDGVENGDGISLSTAAAFHLRDVTVNYMSTISVSSMRSTKESRLGDVMTSREPFPWYSSTDRISGSAPSTSTQPLTETPSSTSSLPRAVFLPEVPSKRIRPSTSLSMTSLTTPLPKRQSTSSWPLQTLSYTMKSRRPGKTKIRRPFGARKTAPAPTVRTSHVRPNSRCSNNAPVIKNPIGKLIHEAGSVLTFSIANDTFVDCEDGDITGLQLLLTSVQYMTLPPNSWIKLNSFTRTLYGLPLDIHVGHHEFILAAIDSDGKIARCPFEVHVRRRPSSSATSHEVSVVINVDYQLFAQLVDKRIDVANKIGSVFGDRDPTQYIVVTRLLPGSVIYTWTNSSLRIKHGNVCPLKEITALASHIQHRDGTLNERFVRMMRPYAIQNASVVPHGPCQEAFRSSPHHRGGHPIDVDDDDDESKPIQVQSRPRDADSDPVKYDSLLYILIPLVILAIILVILLIVICCRELRSRSATKTIKHTKIPSSSSSSSALSTMRCSSKGIPVIFAEELVDGGGGSSAANYYTGKRRRDMAAEEGTPVASSPPDYRASVKHHNDWDVVLSSADKVLDNKALLISDDEEDNDDVSSTAHGHQNSLRYRSADRRTRVPAERDQGSIEKASNGSRGLRPPTQPASYSGNSPPPPYVPSYAL